MLALASRLGSVPVIGVSLLSQGLVNGFKWAPTLRVTACIRLAATGRASTSNDGPRNPTPVPRDLRVCVDLCFTMSQ